MIPNQHHKNAIIDHGPILGTREAFTNPFSPKFLIECLVDMRQNLPAADEI